MKKMRSHLAVVSGFIAVLLMGGAGILLPGCPCPNPWMPEDNATEVLQYWVQGVDLDTPFADIALEPWRWEVLALENTLQTASDLGTQLVDRADVPEPPLGVVPDGYTLVGFRLLEDGQVNVRYQLPENDEPVNAGCRLYAKTTFADETGANAELAVWDFWPDNPEAVEEGARLERLVSYDVQGVTVIGPRGLSPTTRLRVAAQDLWDITSDALEDLSQAIMLDDNDVPVPPDGGVRCSTCAYTKVVNYVVEDYWGDPFAPGCGACGVYIESYSVVIDGILIEDVIKAWDYRY